MSVFDTAHEETVALRSLGRGIDWGKELKAAISTIDTRRVFHIGTAVIKLARAMSSLVCTTCGNVATLNEMSNGTRKFVCGNKSCKRKSFKRWHPLFPPPFPPLPESPRRNTPVSNAGPAIGFGSSTPRATSTGRGEKDSKRRDTPKQRADNDDDHRSHHH